MLLKLGLGRGLRPIELPLQPLCRAATAKIRRVTTKCTGLRAYRGRHLGAPGRPAPPPRAPPHATCEASPARRDAITLAATAVPMIAAITATDSGGLIVSHGAASSFAPANASTADSPYFR